MERTSRTPAILLISSLGAAIPAPTRSIYGSTKAASLALYQALAIEHPRIAFTYILPSTVRGSFRSSAVDAEPQERVASGTESNTAVEDETSTAVSSLNRHSDAASAGAETMHGLSREAVAKRCVAAVDAGEKVVFYPPFYVYAQLLYWMWPSFIERKAAKKYGFRTA
jgi:short-subunit dehydrogenase